MITSRCSTICNLAARAAERLHQPHGLLQHLDLAQRRVRDHSTERRGDRAESERAARGIRHVAGCVFPFAESALMPCRNQQWGLRNSVRVIVVLIFSLIIQSITVSYANSHT